MGECAFLSTCDNKEECFKDCALYNLKENEGICPFKTLSNYKVKRVEEFDDIFFKETELDFIRDYYREMKEEYMV